MLRIRLQRFGKKKAPIYRIVVIERAKKRQGEPTEVLGFYDPKAKLLVYNTERSKYWQEKGAQTTETTKFLLNKTPNHDLLNGPYQYTFETREVKAKKKEELLKTRTKKTKAVRKKLEAANKEEASA
ncbi:MAG: 30S ribosomal protein S16 [Candidatus Caenarcaniphilales bacterium]|jgi:small subunit ribosomal protein S16|nr:30S ribosomal protein S16 [Candidatus Caenarcaniphilales bacterium]